MKQVLLTIAMIAVLLPFLPTKASEQNNLEIRYNSAQIQELIILHNYLASPMPGEK